MASPDPILALARDLVEQLGFELVDLRVSGRRHPGVQLRIDRPGSRPGSGVTAEDCSAVARALRVRLVEALPDRPLDRLEVSSPGIERPVRWPEHWRRYVGERVKVRSPLLRGRPVARIVAVPDDGHVVLRFEQPGAGPDGETDRTFALDEIAEATLVVDWPRP